MSASTEQPWHADFPSPTSTPSSISVEELFDMIKAREAQPGNVKKADFLVVDVRRTDFDTGFIKGAINLPAHSFYPTLPSLLPVLSAYSTVYFHCQSSSCTSRGHRVASWYQDALDAAGIKESKSVILAGGIREWMQKYGETEYTVVLPGPKKE